MYDHLVFIRQCQSFKHCNIFDHEFGSIKNTWTIVATTCGASYGKEGGL
jgi:hypothetical protein